MFPGGRGVGSAEGFDVIRDMADALGAEVGSSRACVDAGWIEKDRQVGQTGKTVRPDLYMAWVFPVLSSTLQVWKLRTDHRYQQERIRPIFEVADLYRWRSEADPA